MTSSPRTDVKFRDLYDEHCARIRSYCLRRLPESEVGDAVADVFLVVWRRIAEAPDGDEARLWLYGIARNVTRNANRSLRRRTRLGGRLGLIRTQSAPDPEMQVVRRSEDEEVLGALARLRPADREILRLSTWEELTNIEIAEVLEIGPHAVTMRLSRARNRLADRLGMTRTPRGASAHPRPVRDGGER